MKIHNKREVQNIATNHSADIDYKDLMNVYRKFTSKSYSFFTIDTALPANNSLRLRKKNFRLFLFMKMRLTDNLKLLMTRLKQIKLNMI